MVAPTPLLISLEKRLRKTHRRHAPEPGALMTEPIPLLFQVGINAMMSR
jgi:hypothetical protein